MRVGIGFDAHRLARGRKLFLAGVEIPHEKGLSGHSDGDVALHALMDALLGALCEGDIGEMFPDSDPSFKDARSTDLLSSVVRKVRGAGFLIKSIDIVVICQEPRISTYRDEMRKGIALLCGVPFENVSIKGKTTEGLGFTGRGEGIASIAVALIEKKAG